jgi:hypothetical protein
VVDLEGGGQELRSSAGVRGYGSLVNLSGLIGVTLRVSGVALRRTAEREGALRRGVVRGSDGPRSRDPVAMPGASPGGPAASWRPRAVGPITSMRRTQTGSVRSKMRSLTCSACRSTSAVGPRSYWTELTEMRRESYVPGTALSQDGCLEPSADAFPEQGPCREASRDLLQRVVTGARGTSRVAVWRDGRAAAHR